MLNPVQLPGSASSRRFRRAGLLFLWAVALPILTQPPAQAQAFTVLHNFTGGAGGANPEAGITIGPSGVLYGTTANGGTGRNYGMVFKLGKMNSSWILNPLYQFIGGFDGGLPYGGVMIGPNGALYGTAETRGVSNQGVVFEVRPPVTACEAALCYWSEAVLHAFSGAPGDGSQPQLEKLVFDQAGNIYGTTEGGGAHGYGAVFVLSPSGGGYTESLLYSFASGGDGVYPYSGVVFDSAGNLYGTTYAGGTGGAGTVYQLTPSGGGWVENVLFNFDGTNGASPFSSLVLDASGNLYGTTYGGGQNGGGVVYKLAPVDGGWTYSALYTFSDYCDSWSGVTMDTAGNFFGACSAGGAFQEGWIFELTNCSQTCTLVGLHDFSGSDGKSPYGTPVLDASGNLYGTTYFGGTGSCYGGPNCGVVWEIAGVGARRND